MRMAISRALRPWTSRAMSCGIRQRRLVRHRCLRCGLRRAVTTGVLSNPGSTDPYVNGIRESDPAGNPILETTVGAINERACRPGDARPINSVHHEVRRITTPNAVGPSWLHYGASKLGVRLHRLSRRHSAESGGSDWRPDHRHGQQHERGMELGRIHIISTSTTRRS